MGIDCGYSMASQHLVFLSLDREDTEWKKQKRILLSLISFSDSLCPQLERTTMQISDRAPNIAIDKVFPLPRYSDTLEVWMLILVGSLQILSGRWASGQVIEIWN